METDCTVYKVGMELNADGNFILRVIGITQLPNQSINQSINQSTSIYLRSYSLEKTLMAN